MVASFGESWDIHPLCETEVKLAKWWSVRNLAEERLKVSLPRTLRSPKCIGYSFGLSCCVAFTSCSNYSSGIQLLLSLACGYTLFTVYICLAAALKFCLDLVLLHPENLRSNFLRFWSQEKHQLFICQVAGRMAGCIAVHPVHDSHDLFEVRRLRVAPEFRGDDLVSALLRRAEEFARNNGGQRLHVKTSNHQSGMVGCFMKERYCLAYKRKAFCHGGLPGLSYVELTFDKRLR